MNPGNGLLYLYGLHKKKKIVLRAGDLASPTRDRFQYNGHLETFSADKPFDHHYLHLSISKSTFLSCSENCDTKFEFTAPSSAYRHSFYIVFPTCNMRAICMTEVFPFHSFS